MAKRTNTLAAAAYSLGVDERLLDAVLPSLKKGIDADKVGAALIADLEGTAKTCRELSCKLAAAREINGEAAILGQMFEEMMRRLRANQHGMMFIAQPTEGAETPNYAFLHRIEEQLTRFKSARVRLACEDGCKCGQDKSQQTSGS